MRIHWYLHRTESSGLLRGMYPSQGSVKILVLLFSKLSWDSRFGKETSSVGKHFALETMGKSVIFQVWLTTRKGVSGIRGDARRATSAVLTSTNRPSATIYVFLFKGGRSCISMGRSKSRRGFRT